MPGFPQRGNGLLAYDVGVGKTATGIVANINQIQTGRSKRPLIIVPNAVYSKWVTDIKQLFPNLKVNELYNFSDDHIKKFRDAEDNHKLNIPASSISVCDACAAPQTTAPSVTQTAPFKKPKSAGRSYFHVSFSRGMVASR